MPVMTERDASEQSKAEVVIRPAEASDHDVILELFRQGMLEGQLRSDDDGADVVQLQEGYFSDEGASGFWVAPLGEEVIGMIGVQKTGENTAEMRRLRVKEAYRRRGVGTTLIEQAIGFCRHHGYLKVILDVRIERGPAIAIFEKFGFTASRGRAVGSMRTLDFYLDLYRQPQA